MKTYGYIDIEADSGEFVPADVAQGLYRALKDAHETLQVLSDDYLIAAESEVVSRAALAAADGEK